MRRLVLFGLVLLASLIVRGFEPMAVALEQCCVDDDCIFADDYEDGSPLAAKYQTTGSNGGDLTTIYPVLTNGAGIDASKGLQSSDFFDEISVLFPTDTDFCLNPRLEFAIGVWVDFSHPYVMTAPTTFLRFGVGSESDNTGIGYVDREPNRDLVVRTGSDPGGEIYRLRNAFLPGTYTLVEIRGSINSFDADGTAQADGWIEVSINGFVYYNGEDVDAIDVNDITRDQCPKEGTREITWRNTEDGINSPNKGWDRVSFIPQGRMDCVYIKERAAYCVNGATSDETKPPCPPPVPGVIPPGGLVVGPSDYIVPTGGGISAVASDPTDPQSLTGISTPLVSLDVTLCDSTVRLCGQADILEPDWQVQRFSPVEYARSDRFGHVRAQTWEVEIADPDGDVRAALTDPVNRFYRRWQAQEFIEEASLTATPRLSLARGLCVAVNTDSPLVVRVTLADELSAKNSPVSLERQLPPLIVHDVFMAGCAGTWITISGNAPQEIRGQGIQQLYGECSDERKLLTAGTPVGIVKFPYVGNFLLGSGEVWHGYSVCHYAAKKIAALFASNLAPCPGSVRQDLNSGEFLIPGYGNWASYFSTQHLDLTLNGVTTRQTMIFGRGPRSQQAVDGIVPLSGNVWGKEDVGDGSGNLIVSGAQIVQALFHWPIGQRAKLGNEALPTFDDGVSKFRTSSAVDCDGIHGARLEDGYTGALIVDERKPAADWLASALVSYHLHHHINHHGQSVLTTFDDAQSLTGLPTFTAVDHVRGDTFKTTSDRAGELENARTYDGGPEPATGRLTIPPTTLRAEASIANWDASGEPYKGDALHLVGVYLPNVAADVVGRYLLETQDGITRGEWATDFDLFAVKPGQIFRITDFRGLGSTGWTRRVLLADAIVVNPNVSNPPQEDDLGVTVRWQDVHGILVALGEDDELSAVGFAPLGSSVALTGTVLGSSVAGTGRRLG